MKMTLTDAVSVLEENTGVNFGELTWEDGMACLTREHITGIFKVLFEELYLTVKEYSGEDYMSWKFEFEYKHPDGSENGKAIGTVFFQNDDVQYRADRF